MESTIVDAEPRSPLRSLAEVLKVRIVFFDVILSFSWRYAQVNKPLYVNNDVKAMEMAAKGELILLDEYESFLDRLSAA